MRKRSAFFLTAVFFLISLTGCTAKEQVYHTPEEAKNPFSAEVQLEYKNTQAQALVRKNTYESYEIELQSPDVLKGMKVIYKEGLFLIEYRGLSGSYKMEDIPGGAAAKTMIAVLEKIASEEETVYMLEDEKLKSQDFYLGEQQVLIEVDKQSGRILTIELPQQEFSAFFSQYY